jgi:hypothetical protein
MLYISSTSHLYFVVMRLACNHPLLVADTRDIRIGEPCPGYFSYI